MAQTVGFLIMRAQPLHNGHIGIIKQALQQCDRLVILLGSVNRPCSLRNPWNYHERKLAISNEFQRSNISFYPLNDYKYSDSQWLLDVNSIITLEKDKDFFTDIVMFGHNKPGNDYLSLFPKHLRYVELKSDYPGLSATDLREELAQSDRLPYAAMMDWAFFREEATKFSGYPYPETLNFNCSDAIVECNGHIVLIRRKRAPGIGNWALPGGMKNRNETFLDCALRELNEEVNIRVSDKVLRGSIVQSRLFDAPDRGQGIPRNTLAVHIRIRPDNDGNLPRIAPADDALEAVWVRIDDAMNKISMHDDHQDIISIMLNVVPNPAHLNPRFQ